MSELREKIGKLACELCDPADLEQMCIPYNAMLQCNTRKRRVDTILAAFVEAVEGMPRSTNPFPESFEVDDENSPEDIWEPIYTRNTLNGFAHDAFEAGWWYERNHIIAQLKK